MLVVVERINKQQTLVTYRDLVAFSENGEPVDRDYPSQQRSPGIA